MSKRKSVAALPTGPPTYDTMHIFLIERFGQNGVVETPRSAWLNLYGQLKNAKNR